jgi:magnesium chelatase family protein
VFDELGLAGFVRAVPGVVPARLAVARAGHCTVVVPGGDAGEADYLADVLPGHDSDSKTARG